MEGCADRQRYGAPDAVFGREFCRAIHRGFCPADHDLSRRVIIGDLGDLAFRGGGGKALRHFDIGSEQGQHGPLPLRHGLLHGLPAQAQQLRGLGHGERASSGERRIFAERMACHEHRLERVWAIFLAKCGVGGKRYGHEGGLRVRRERQGL